MAYFSPNENNHVKYIQLRTWSTDHCKLPSVIFTVFIDFCVFFVYHYLLLFRDAWSPGVSMEVLVCLTRKNKLFHVFANHLGLETDVKLDWVKYQWQTINESVLHVLSPTRTLHHFYYYFRLTATISALSIASNIIFATLSGPLYYSGFNSVSVLKPLLWPISAPLLVESHIKFHR